MEESISEYLFATKSDKDSSDIFFQEIFLSMDF